MARSPEILDEIYDLLIDDDPVVAMRSSYVAMKVAEADPESTWEFKKKVVRDLPRYDQQGVRWHIPQLLIHMNLTRTERRKAYSAVMEWSETDKSKIVAYYGLEAAAQCVKSMRRLSRTSCHGSASSIKGEQHRSPAGAARLPRGWTSSYRRRVAETTGGVAPVGRPERLRTIVDIALSRYGEVWAEGGHPHYEFPTNCDELLQITTGDAAEVGARLPHSLSRAPEQAVQRAAAGGACGLRVLPTRPRRLLRRAAAPYLAATGSLL